MSQPIQALPSALGSVEDIFRSVKGKEVVVFLDYDGTLIPIVERPELATMAGAMRSVVKRLAELCTVAIISGRDRADVERLVNVDSLFYAGSHGFDIAGPQRQPLRHEAGSRFSPELDRAEEFLRGHLAGVEGALIERKRYTIAVHYRLVADENLQQVGMGVDSVLTSFPMLRKRDGKKVYEVQPNLDWDKGKAVLWLLEALGLRADAVVPFYIGDDLTDEDAFHALRDRGVGIVVGEGSRLTTARYALRDPDEVRQLLDQIVTALRGRVA